jgi:predicted amidohydrolase
MKPFLHAIAVCFAFVPASVVASENQVALARSTTGDQSVRAENARRLRIGLVNIKSLTSAGSGLEANRANIRANLERHRYFIDRLSREGVDFVGFPELSINGYRFSPTMTWLSATGPELQTLRQAAVEKHVYVGAGFAEEDAGGKRWNTHVVIDPRGEIIGRHRKIWLTKEKDFVETGSTHEVFDVKGMKMGMVICADGTDRKNLQALVDQGAQLIYGPHANTTGGTTAGWYRFRAPWSGPQGWIAEMKVFAALHNHAGLFNPEWNAPATADTNSGWASGAWIIGPDGETRAQMPVSAEKSDSKEYILIHDVPIASRE